VFDNLRAVATAAGGDRRSLTIYLTDLDKFPVVKPSWPSTGAALPGAGGGRCRLVAARCRRRIDGVLGF
jgi:hypothetical protein